jgi:hypothetical protein
MKALFNSQDPVIKAEVASILSSESGKLLLANPRSTV